MWFLLMNQPEKPELKIFFRTVFLSTQAKNGIPKGIKRDLKKSFFKLQLLFLQQMFPPLLLCLSVLLARIQSHIFHWILHTERH